MRGNWGFLIFAAGALLGLVSTALGAHLYRWEAITWYATAGVMSLLGWTYSRREE